MIRIFYNTFNFSQNHYAQLRQHYMRPTAVIKPFRGKRIQSKKLKSFLMSKVAHLSISVIFLLWIDVSVSYLVAIQANVWAKFDWPGSKKKKKKDKKIIFGLWQLLNLPKQYFEEDSKKIISQLQDNLSFGTKYQYLEILGSLDAAEVKENPRIFNPILIVFANHFSQFEN